MTKKTKPQDNVLNQFMCCVVFKCVDGITIVIESTMHLTGLQWQCHAYFLVGGVVRSGDFHVKHTDHGRWRRHVRLQMLASF